jgi:hypothetical protein
MDPILRMWVRDYGVFHKNISGRPVSGVVRGCLDLINHLGMAIFLDSGCIKNGEAVSI